MYILDDLHRNLGDTFSRIWQTLHTAFRFPSSCFCRGNMTIGMKSSCISMKVAVVLTAAANRPLEQLRVAKGGRVGHLPIQPVHNLTKPLRSYSYGL